MARKIYCNMCGKAFDIFDFQEDFSIDRYAGFGTTFDGDHLKLDLCCGCMEKIVESCRISPLESAEKNELLEKRGVLEETEPDCYEDDSFFEEFVKEFAKEGGSPIRVTTWTIENKDAEGRP